MCLIEPPFCVDLLISKISAFIKRSFKEICECISEAALMDEGLLLTV
jgi:hypothetical protein